MTTKAKSTKSDKAYDDVLGASKDSLDGAMKATTEAASKGYEQAMAYGQQHMDQAVKSYDELAKFNKETAEALVSAGNLAAQGAEEVNADLLAFAQVQVEESVAAAKAVFGAKTVQEAFELQANFAKTHLDAYVAQTTKIGEMMTRTTQLAFEPINSRYATVAEKFGKSAI